MAFLIAALLPVLVCATELPGDFGFLTPEQQGGIELRNAGPHDAWLQQARELSELIVNDHRDIDDLIPRLSEYLGFSERESLSFIGVEERTDRWIYHYAREIDGTPFFWPTSTFVVDKETRQIMEAAMKGLLQSAAMQQSSIPEALAYDPAAAKHIDVIQVPRLRRKTLVSPLTAAACKT